MKRKATRLENRLAWRRKATRRKTVGLTTRGTTPVYRLWPEIDLHGWDRELERHRRSYIERHSNPYEPLPWEQRLKEFVMEESIRRGVVPESIYADISRGRYPALSIRRYNSKVVFVCGPATRAKVVHLPEPEELPLKDWVTREANRIGQNIHTIYMRVFRGKYPGLKIRRVNQRVAFVKVAP